jgi:acid phosphatase type 7
MAFSVRGHRRNGLFASLCVAILSASTIVPAEVMHVYLTWQGDTSTTMTVNYHTANDTAESTVLFDSETRGGNSEAYAFRAAGRFHRIPGLNMHAGADRAIHVVELTGLRPGRDYYFIAGDPVTGYTEERKFRTAPAGDAPVRFITGGDIGTDPVVGRLMRQAAATDPLFGLIGGDIAYANGNFEEWTDWEVWLKFWQDTMVGPEGHTIPMVLAIGNHEVNDKVGPATERAPFFFGYFAQQGASLSPDSTTFFRRSFGANVVIYALDSGHIADVDQEQRDWLQAVLEYDRDIPYKFPVYHVPMYPSHRLYVAPTSKAERDHWAPLFDEFGVVAAFENHDHMYKRTKRMRANQPHPEGVLYLGDGAFGRNPRTGDQARSLSDPEQLARMGLLESYLEKWEARLHFILVEVPARAAGEPIQFTAIDDKGVAFDTYALK